MNITDIDDKIITRAMQEDQDPIELARRWEEDFFTQMSNLGVQIPDKIVRVSEHINEIIKYTERIINNGFAYESNSSVYFDVDAFVNAGYTYCKLMPTSQTEDRFQDQEAQPLADKRKSTDFALWKKSKPGEPSWYSPWGKGRPGWHIECSAMIESILQKGEVLTIHSGGADLKFPHHDNEIAQGEAHNCSQEWVQYFLHCAPLNINGLKMSKSLKNFITVNEALKILTARQIRLLFLLHKYNNPMNLDPDNSFEHAKQKDRTIAEFVSDLSYRLKGIPHQSQQSLKLSQEEQALEIILHNFLSLVDVSLRSNFDMSSVLISLLADVIPSFRSYLQTSKLHNVCLLSSVEREVCDILSTFGLDYARPMTSSLDVSEKLVDVIVAFRKEIISEGKSIKSEKILQATDTLRDFTLRDLGVRIEDGTKGRGWIWDSTKSTENQPTVDITKKEQLESIFLDKKYYKFRIGSIGEDGLPNKDTEGNPFPNKVVDRFKRDLNRHKQGLLSEGSASSEQ